MKFAHFDDMCFPIPDGEVEWKLRYGKPTRQELLFAASVLSAYQGLIFQKTQKSRNYAVSQIKLAILKDRKGR